MRSLVRMTLVVGGAVLFGEVADRWSRRGSHAGPAGDVAVVVLGYPGHTPPGRALQRWRVRMGIRALERHPGARLVLSGGVTFGAVSEAAQMASIARAMGAPTRSILLDERSTTTWENVMFSRPLVDRADRIVLVSDGVHAARARRYWLRQFPHDAGRVVVDPISVPLEAAWLKGPSAIGQVFRAPLRRVLGAPPDIR